LRLPKEHHEEFEKGIAEFNQREFFECHETLEGVWQKHQAADRELIQGIIQVSVGYYHLLRDNSVGALKLLRRGVGRIEKFVPIYFDLDLEPFVAQVSADITTTEENAHPPVMSLRIPRIEFVSPRPDC
jgi:uncharacterized protein